MPRTWFITGCATGFGRALAEAALAHGDQVAVTDRDRQAVVSMEHQFPDSALALGVDVTDPQQVRAGLAACIAAFGRVDLLVNNAGFAVQAAVEEADISAVRAMFDVNLFGMLDVILAALPHLRAQGAGHIINFASVGGRVSGPLMALYCASKFAVEGLGEGLAAELAPHGIRVTTIEPGAFATRFGASAVGPVTALDAYAPLHDAMAGHLANLPQGDPADLAGAILELAACDQPPLRLVAGQDARLMIEASLAAQQDEITRWQDLTDRANGAARQAG